MKHSLKLLLPLLAVLFLTPSCWWRSSNGHSNAPSQGLAPLSAIAQLSNPDRLRFIVNPLNAFPQNVAYFILRHSGTSGPNLRYKVDGGKDLKASPAAGELRPGEEVKIFVQALTATFTLAALAIVITYALASSTQQVRKAWDFRNGAAPPLAALTIISLLTGQDPLTAGLFWPALILALIGAIVIHSKGGKLNRIPLLFFTEIVLVGVMAFVMTLAMLHANFYRSKTSQSFAAVNFPPGQGNNGYTIHPDNEVDQKAGKYFFFHMSMAAPIPIKDSDTKNQHVYSFVMDADGKSSNNWIPNPAFPNDFFKGTDRWYQIFYDSSKGWRMTVTTVNSGGKSIKSTTSAARAIIKDEAIVLVVPAAEFSEAKPKWRATSFVHKGDFGLNPPNFWSGDVMPPVATGLNTMK